MKQLALALILIASTPVEAAACHRYSHWFYPFPQRCAVARQMTFARVIRPHRPTSEPDMPLPSLARADLEGGEADDEAKGRLLLRAALEAR
jgi:hypothetical protein